MKLSTKLEGKRGEADISASRCGLPLTSKAQFPHQWHGVDPWRTPWFQLMGDSSANGSTPQSAPGALGSSSAALPTQQLSGKHHLRCTSVFFSMKWRTNAQTSALVENSVEY